MGGICSIHGRDEKCIQKFWWGNLKGRGHSEDLSVDGRLERILGKQGEKVWTGFITLRIGTSGGLMGTW